MTSEEAEAKKCIDMAIVAINKENWSKAEEFLDKSMKLNPSEKAQNLLSKLDTLRRKEKDSGEDTRVSTP